MIVNTNVKPEDAVEASDFNPFFKKPEPVKHPVQVLKSIYGLD